MEGIKDQQVQSRGGAEFIGERDVNEVDKEFVREQGDCLIVLRSFFLIALSYSLPILVVYLLGEVDVIPISILLIS